MELILYCCECAITAGALFNSSKSCSHSLSMAAASKSAPREEILDEYRRGASLSHMDRFHRSRIPHDDRADRQQHQCRKAIQPPRGEQAPTKAAPPSTKEVAGRYYQLPSGHAVIEPYLCDRIRKIDSDRCWWCDSGERQSYYHLFARCKAWAPRSGTRCGRRLGREGLQVETPAGPLGQAVLEGQGDGGGLDS